MIRAYDNGGRSFDRYTVIFKDGECLGIGDTGNVPNGFCMHVGSIHDGSVVEGDHLGDRVELRDLPTPVRKAISGELHLWRYLRKQYDA